MSLRTPRRDFDLVVVGSGVAASVAVDRLLASGAVSRIAVIEAGTAAGSRAIRTPLWYQRLWDGNRDWSWQTEPQATLRGRRIDWPRGRGLGGSGMMNAMILSLGHADDAKAYPAGFDLPAARSRLRHLMPREWLADPMLHPASQRFLRESEAAGFPPNDDPLITDAGSIAFRRTLVNGQRFHAADHFLKRHIVKRRTDDSPVQILARSTVERLVIRNGRVTAVEVRDRWGTQELTTARGVVLAAGAIGTPVLLQRSGVGRRGDTLGKCAVDSPWVGYGVRDHLVAPLIFAASSEQSLPAMDDAAAAAEYRTHRRGPLASNVAEAGLFARLNGGQLIADDARPDVQIHFTPTHYLQYATAAPPANTWAVTYLPAGNAGSVVFRNGQVVIDPVYLADEEEQRRWADSLVAAADLAERCGWTPEHRLLPRPGPFDERAARRLLAAYGLSIYHPVGSCRMGASLEEGVVDAKGRVFGLDNAWIVDASVLPDLPTGNPQGTVMAVAAAIAEGVALQ